MWAWMANCDRLACDTHAEVAEEVDLPQGWYEIVMGVGTSGSREAVSETLGIFCSLEHVIETLQLRSPASQEHELDVRSARDVVGAVAHPVDPPRPEHHHPRA